MPASAAADTVTDETAATVAPDPAAPPANDAEATPAPDPTPPPPPDPATTPAPTAPTSDPGATPATGQVDTTTAPGSKGTQKQSTSSADGSTPGTSKPKAPAPGGAPPATKQPPAATTPDTPAGTAKDPSTTANRQPSADPSDRPVIGAQDPAPQPPPAPPQPAGAVGRVSAPVSPAVVVTPAVAAHGLEPAAAPRAALTAKAPEHVAGDSEPSNVLVSPAWLRPATPGAPAAPTPALALPAYSTAIAQPAKPEAVTHGKAHGDKPPRVSRPAPQRAPHTPSGPPDRDPVSVAGSAASSGGGVSAAMWSAVLLGIWLCLAGDLRRHRGRLLLAGPPGVPSPQQRPG